MPDAATPTDQPGQLVPAGAASRFAADQERFLALLQAQGLDVALYASAFNPYPFAVTAQRLGELLALQHAIRRALVAVVTHFARDDRLSGVIRLPAAERELLGHLAGRPYRVGAFRPDFLHALDGSEMISEINARFPLNAFPSSAVLNRCVPLANPALAPLPPLRRHLDGPGGRVSPWRVLAQPAHLRAYALMAALVLGMFTLIPYLPTFLIANVGWQEGDLRWMYLCGGAVSLVTNSLFGRLADRFGKLIVFRVLALLTMVPILLLTNLGPTPLSAALVLTTMLFVGTSGRMVPAVALVTSSARPAYRGSFMSINSSVQQLAMGLAALLAGVMLHQAAPGQPIEGYPLVGLLACATTVLSVWLAGAVRPAEEGEASEPADTLPLAGPAREAS